MHITIPENFKEISESDFQEFLKHCPDYIRDSYNLIRYSFLYNDKVFAYAGLIPSSGFRKTSESAYRIFIDPDLIEKPK